MVNVKHFFILLIIFITSLNLNCAYAKATSHQKSISHNIHQAQYIEPSYLLQITLDKENCKKITKQECFFRDKFLSKPYLHETILTIFGGKIFAMQNFFDSNVEKLMKINDGTYKAYTDNENIITFQVKNGEISELQLLNGDLNIERRETSKCAISKILYSFYQATNRQKDLSIKSGDYRDEYDFDGIKEYIVFAEKINPSEIFTLTKTADKIDALHNIQLCKSADSNISNVRHFTSDECDLKNNKQNPECLEYHNCQDHLIVEECNATLFLDGFDD